MKKNSVYKMVLMAMLISLMFVLVLVQQLLGLLPLSGFTITLLSIPVGIAASVLGPVEGMAMGGLFGLISLLQCGIVPLFGLDPMGVTLLEEKTFLTIMLCFVPRILMGAISGLISRGFKKFGTQDNKVREIIGAASCPLLNTVLFLSFFQLFFGNNSSAFSSIGQIIKLAITVNGTIEFLVCSTLIVFISLAIRRFICSKRR